MEEKVKALMADEAFTAKLLECEAPEAVQGVFAAEGLDFTLEEVKMMGNLIAQQLEKKENGEDCELDEDDLSAVAGGIAVFDVVAGIVGGLGGTLGGGGRIADPTLKKLAHTAISVGKWFRRW